MSDSVKNPDIEDVLSSIRRLVSHEGGRKATNINDAPASDDQSSKLVLTPALRVEQDDVVEEQSPAQNDTLSEDEALELMTPDVPLAFTSARAAKQKADDEEQALVLEHPLVVADDTPQIHSADVETPAEDIAEDAPENVTQSEDHQQHDVAAEVTASEDAASQPEHHTPTAHESLTAKIAALEEVIGREPDQWEPESEGLGENAGTDVDALPWEDHVDAPDTDVSADTVHVEDETASVEAQAAETLAPVDTAEDSDQDTSTGADVDLSDMDDTILDEAMLRDLVSNIVREELQGALGERITRNVRKLVRREIHRALSAQDFN